MARPRKFFTFPEFRDHVLSVYLRFYPTLASSLGLHEYDGLIEDYSAARREQYVHDLTCSLDALLEFSVPAEEQGRFEYRAIEWKLRDELFRLTELRDFEWNPLVYNDQLELTHLVDRDFAPITDRMRSVLLRVQAYPRVLAVARQNLSAHIDRTIVETALLSFQGRLDYLEELPSIAFEKIEDTKLLEDLSEAVQSAKLAISSFIEAVRTVVLPNALYDSFRLGANLLERYIHSAELVDEPLESILEKGKREMDRLTVELFKASEELDPTASPREVFHTFVESEHFSEQNILTETASMLERIRAFVLKHNLVAIPSEVRCTVQETPAHMRWAAAAMFSPGAFEK